MFKAMRDMFFPMLAIAALSASPAVAGTVTVQVRDARGAPVPNAVVSVHLQGRPTPPPRGGGRYEVEQRNIQFHPFVMVVPVNSDVSFPNRDAVRHHVYSFAAAKRFELKLYAREQNRSVRFDKPGIVALGCNIHDAMSAFVAVVDTPWAATTDAAGNVRIANVPDGAAAIDVWHPYLRAPGNRVARVVRVAPGDGVEGFAVPLRQPGRPGAAGH